jgi:putative DNA primase/helicase
LQSRGAEVFWIEWPDDLPAECNGADDYLTAFSEAAFARLLEVGRREAGAVLLKLTDAEFLNRFAEDYGEFFVYVEDWGRWGAWRGARWDFEHGIADLWAQIPALAQEICEQEKDTAIFDPKKFSAFCKRYQMRDGINAIRAMAECDRRFRRSVAQFDAQPWLLNCANGTLDLTTGELKAPEPGDYIRQQAPTAWNPEAACPKFEQFLQVTAQGSQSWIDYLQQVLGYCLTGDNGAQAIWVLHGNSGQNGKSVLLKTMAGVLGPDYVKTIDAAAFMPRFNAAGHDDKLASVGGCRLLVISEPDEGQRLDMGVIKRITGDSEIRVSFKGQRNFVLPITFKGILVCNELPEMRQVDGGTWRRWKPIPFLNRISDEERIDRLEEILLTEREGILAWCVRGLHDYLENGCRFREPASTTDAAKEYRESSDDLQAFISECCNVADGLSGSSTALHQAYLAFNGKRAKYQSARAFTQAMFNKGFGRRKTNHGRYITGLALAASDNDENSE